MGASTDTPEDVSGLPADDTSDRPRYLDCPPEVREDLHALLAGLEHGSDTLDEDLRRLAQQHGETVYCELIYMLSHLNFPTYEGKPHWDKIVAHRARMQKTLGKRVDLRVALISYFLDVNRKLQNPKIIEMRLFEREQACAYRDQLTGLYNYRLFREHLERECYRVSRCSKPLSLVMIDVDDFKCYNDRNGHESGNQALAGVARHLTSAMRRSDLAARYGGEEFVLVLPATPKRSARLIAERARVAIARQTFDGAKVLPGGRLTVSMGVATFPADADDASELIRHADRALYDAKARGKNQVCLYGESQRSYGRVGVTLPGTFRVLSDESHTLTTVNVSEAGMLFRTDRQIRTGTLVECTLQTDPDRQVTASGRIVHVENGGDGTFRTAVQITDARSADRTRLMEIVRQADAGEFADLEAAEAHPAP